MYLERVILQGLLGACLGEIDGDWVAAFGVQGQGENDAVAGIIGI